MKAFRSAFGTIVKINAMLLYATLLAFVSFYNWPPDSRWWGFAIVSICTGAAAVFLAGQAVKLMIELRTRDATITEIENLGTKQKSSRLADEQTLKDAGLIE